MDHQDRHQLARLPPDGLGCGAAFSWQLPRLRQPARPVYVERGILHEIAAGLSAPATLRDGMER